MFAIGFILIIIVFICILMEIFGSREEPSYRSHNPEILGRQGEACAAEASVKAFSEENTIFLYNTYLPWKNGSTTEVDQIIFSTSGCNSRQD